MDNKVKLFQTAKNIYERGDISLSAADRKRIEDETKDLLRKSTLYRSASKVSKSFVKVLEDLGESKDPGDSFKIVARYLHAEGVLNGDIEEILESIEEAVEDIGEAVDQAEEVLGEEEPKKDDIKDEEKKKPEGENLFTSPDKEKDEEKEESKEKKPDNEGVPDFLKNVDKAKEAVIRIAQEFDMMQSGPPISLAEDRIMDKGKGKGPFRKKPTKLKDIEDKDKLEEKVTEDEMGIEKGIPGKGVFANVKVSITPDKNIVASCVDKGPLFLAIPRDEIKSDPEKLRRAANKVLGLIIYDGPKVAAEKCNARLIAQVDEGIMTDSDKEVEPNRNDVTDESESDTREDRPEDPNTALEGNNTDSEDKPDKVVAIKKRLEEKRKAKFEKESKDTILDKNEDDTEETPKVNPNILDATGNDETDTEVDRPGKPEDILVDSDDDIREVEANYKKLYANRAKKEASEKVKEFIDKFARCMRIVSKRMALNHDDNPLKAAMIDVLTSDDIRFSNDEIYAPMDTVTAKELTELTSSEGHDEFVKHLLNRTSELMKKSDEYLSDIEDDISNLTPIDVEVEDNLGDFEPIRGNKSAELRKAATEGNFDVNTSLASSNVGKSQNLIRDAIGSTKIGMRTARLKSVAGR